MLFDLQPGRHRRNVFHAHHQCARGGDPRRVPVEHAAGMGRQAVRAQADSAAVAFLGPSRHRRCGGRTLQQLPRGVARGHEKVDAMKRLSVAWLLATLALSLASACDAAEELVTIPTRQGVTLSYLLD